MTSLAALRRLAAAFATVLIAPCVLAQSAPLRETLQHGDLARTYLMQVPRGGSATVPLVILLHGGTQDAERIWPRTRWPEVARREGVLLVAPDAVDGNWNDGRRVYLSGGDPTAIDDVGFLSELVGSLVARHRADPGRVFVTGASNGGAMAWRFACERSEIVTAIAPVIATMLSDPDRRCPASRPVAVLAIFGTADPLMPFDGSPVRTRTGQMSEPRLSAAASVQWWAQRNGCGTTPVAEDLPDRVTTDGSTVRRFVYPGCPFNADAIRIDVLGGGHTWPGGRTGWLQKQVLGPTNRDIDAAETAWNFFRERRR